jgi:ATP-dependent Clp protease ATP-binding subunit ClpC
MTEHGFSFTDHVRRALQAAREEATRLEHEYIATEHILLGLLLIPDGPVPPILAALEVDPTDLRAAVEACLKPGRPGSVRSLDLPYTSRAGKALEGSMLEARELRDPYVDSQHVLLGLLREAKGLAGQVMVHCGLTLESVRAASRRLGATGTADYRAPPSNPINITVVAEYADGRLAAKRFARIDDALAHLQRWTHGT